MLGKVFGHFGIYPYDGKRVLQVRDGKFHSGSVIGSTALTDGTGAPLYDLNDPSVLEKVVEAANALGAPPFKIEKRLEKGENVLYRPRLRG